jgi:hypothetical protein
MHEVTLNNVPSANVKKTHAHQRVKELKKKGSSVHPLADSPKQRGLIGPLKFPNHQSSTYSAVESR